MNTLKKGMIITDSNGLTCKILAVCDELYALSYDNATDSDDRFKSWYTITQLKELGYTWDEPKWEPMEGKEYYFLKSDGSVESLLWNDDSFDKGVRDFLGIYRTAEECEAAIADIKKKLGK